VLACKLPDLVLANGAFALPLTFDRRAFAVAGAFLVQAVTIGCVFAYGVFFNELETEFGWSRTL